MSPMLRAFFAIAVLSLGAGCADGGLPPSSDGMFRDHDAPPRKVARPEPSVPAHRRDDIVACARALVGRAVGGEGDALLDRCAARAEAPLQRKPHPGDGAR